VSIVQIIGKRHVAGVPGIPVGTALIARALVASDQQDRVTARIEGEENPNPSLRPKLLHVGVA